MTFMYSVQRQKAKACNTPPLYMTPQNDEENTHAAINSNMTYLKSSA